MIHHYSAHTEFASEKDDKIVFKRLQVENIGVGSYADSISRSLKYRLKNIRREEKYNVKYVTVRKECNTKLEIWNTNLRVVFFSMKCKEKDVGKILKILITWKIYFFCHLPNEMKGEKTK